MSHSDLSDAIKKEIMSAFKGGKGSGHWGHIGRPGLVGGSAPKDETASGGQYQDLKKASGDPENATRFLESVVGKPSTSFKSDGIREKTKDDICKRIVAENPDITYAEANRVLSEWAEMSVARLDGVAELHIAAAEEFGSDVCDYYKGVYMEYLSGAILDTMVDAGEVTKDEEQLYLCALRLEQNKVTFRQVSELVDYCKPWVNKDYAYVISSFIYSTDSERKELLSLLKDDNESVYRTYKEKLADKKFVELANSMRSAGLKLGYRTSPYRITEVLKYAAKTDDGALAKVAEIARKSIDNSAEFRDSRRRIDTARKVLRAVYKITQEEFKKRGIKGFSLYRGVKIPVNGKKFKYKGNAIESWTPNKHTASIFGRSLLTAFIPADRIMSTAATGIGCLSEYEFVVIGGTPESVDVIAQVTEKGGDGSGHWGHVGRPGLVGGSSPKDETASGVSEDALWSAVKKLGKPIYETSFDDAMQKSPQMKAGGDIVNYWITDDDWIFTGSKLESTHSRIAAATIAGGFVEYDFTDEDKKAAIALAENDKFEDEGIEGIFEKRGWIRVGLYRDADLRGCIIRTSMPVSKSTLRKIQKWMDSGFIPRVSQIAITFDGFESEQIFDYDELLAAGGFMVVGDNVTAREKSLALKGGEGSGNYGHAGRPGKVGGSAPSGTSSTPSADNGKPAKSASVAPGVKRVGDAVATTVQKSEIRQLGGKKVTPQEIDDFLTQKWSGNFDKKQVAEWLKDMPSGMFEGVKGVQVLSREEFAEKYAAAAGERPDEDVYGFYWTLDSQVYMIDTELTKYGVIHEISHSVYFDSGKKSLWNSRYKNDDNFDRHSSYSRTSDIEGFAETFAHLIADGGAPQFEIDVIQSVMDGINPMHPKYRKKSLKGGEGSGHWGHVGRPGKVGGSRPKGQMAHGTEFTDSGFIDSLSTYNGMGKYGVAPDIAVLQLGRALKGNKKGSPLAYYEAYRAQYLAATKSFWEQHRLANLIARENGMTGKTDGYYYDVSASQDTGDLRYSIRIISENGDALDVHVMIDGGGKVKARGEFFKPVTIRKPDGGYVFVPEVGRDYLADGGQSKFIKKIKEAFNYSDEKSGLRAELTELSCSEELIIGARGVIVDKNGRTVGKFTRAFLFTPSVVRHGFFAIDDSHQGTGFGSRFYERCEKAYTEVGLKAIGMTANISVGGYAWARVGFDFKDEDERNSVIRRFTDYCKAKLGHTPDFSGDKDGIIRAWDIASYSYKGVPLGKNFMMGISWSGIKMLGSGEGFDIGNLYYKEKKKKKSSHKERATQLYDRSDGMTNAQAWDEPDIDGDVDDAWRAAALELVSRRGVDNIADDIYKELSAGFTKVKGGKGSGHWGHAGRRGLIGGSKPKGSMASGAIWDEDIEKAKRQLDDKVYMPHGGTQSEMEKYEQIAVAVAAMIGAGAPNPLDLIDHVFITSSNADTLAFFESHREELEKLYPAAAVDRYIAERGTLFSACMGLYDGAIGCVTIMNKDNYNYIIPFVIHEMAHAIYYAPEYVDIRRKWDEAYKYHGFFDRRTKYSGQLPQEAFAESFTYLVFGAKGYLTEEEMTMSADATEEDLSIIRELFTKTTSKGSERSGHWGHRGRPGKVGGSRPKGETASGSDGGVYDAYSTESYYKNPDGTWKPERAELHKKIIEQFFAGKSPKASPETLFVCGGPASGKSTLIASGALEMPDDYVYMSPDAVKELLPEYQELIKRGDKNAARFVHDESKYLSIEIAMRATAESYNLVVDILGGGGVGRVEGIVERYRRDGRKIRAAYIFVPIEVALERSRKRFEKTGRAVPDSIIYSETEGIARILPELMRRDIFGSLDVYDNTGSKPILIASGSGGKIKIHLEDKWKAFFRG